ncbi:gamma-glutamyltransferase [Variovorax saccharolyticus]|uniref:gamma-glutamyltransferase n=1 Tax=Variovorax saccharolyticus TaxID=3053516 RepID=UPI002578CAFA|nr:gamma-glutamyltransferase [Variovorax sp. J22R187]MDM0022417.1 gamma-glutamyltransferase [Variovorax sp. J22R187]
MAAAELGYLVTERLARDWARQTAKMMANAEARELFFRTGLGPRVGERRSNPHLGKTLADIGRTS